MAIKRLPSGFEVSEFCLRPEIRAALKAQAKLVEELRARLKRWLDDSRSTARRPRFSISVQEARSLAEILTELERLRGCEVELAELRHRDWALQRLYRKDGPRAVVRALGWSSGTRGASYPREQVVEAYQLLIGRQPRLHVHSIEPGPRKPKLDLAEAVRLVASRFEFNSPEACLKFLVRARRQLKVERNEGFLALRCDFPLPAADRLDRLPRAPRVPSSRREKSND